LGRYSFILLLFFCGLNLAQTFPEKSVDSLLVTGIDRIIREDYHSAEKIFLQLKKERPELPLGDIYLAATVIARSVDFHEVMNTEKIENYFAEAENIADSLYDEEDENIWNLYFKGLLSGYRAYNSSLNGDYFGAFTDGYDAYSYYSKCLEIDTLFYEAYIAIGSFEYWISAKTEFFGFLPFYEDSRQNGIMLLKTAWKKASYNSHLAAYSLIWIYINEKRYQDAINLAEEELKKYPETRFFKWGLANAYKYIDKRKAIEILNQIYDSYENAGRNILTPKIVIKHKIAMLENDLGELESALKLCDDILNNCEKIKNKSLELQQRCSRAEELKTSILNKK